MQLPICLSSIFPHPDGKALCSPRRLSSHCIKKVCFPVSFDLEVPLWNEKNKRFQRSRKTWKNGSFCLHISKMRLFLNFSHTVSPNTFIHALLNYPSRSNYGNSLLTSVCTFSSMSFFILGRGCHDTILDISFGIRQSFLPHHDIFLRFLKKQRWHCGVQTATESPQN